MYCLQVNDRRVIITPKEVIKKTPTSNELDLKKVANAIEIAEDRFLRDDVLGFDFYYALAVEKNRDVTSDNLASLQALFTAQDGAAAVVLQVGDVVNASEFLSADHLKLWNEGLWKFTAECVRLVAIPENYTELTSQGIMKNNPIASALADSTQTSVGASLNDVKFLMDTWMNDRIEPLKASLNVYLTRNYSLYPTWTGYSGCRDRSDAGRAAQQPQKRTDWIDTSIYRDEDEDGRCGCVWNHNR